MSEAPSTPEARSRQEARAALEAAGRLPEGELDLAAVALQCARIDRPEADWRAAAATISALTRDLLEAVAADPQADAGDLERRRLAIASVLEGFAGDSETYDDLANANLIAVLARRRGLPVALGLLWLHLAEAAGWPAHGIDFPGHFLIALEGPGGALVIDPFHGGIALDAPALRQLLKTFEGEKAELRPGVLVPMGKRAVLLRLQTNIKLRRLGAGDLEGALTCAEDMLRFAPETAMLWRETGLMNARLDRLTAALTSLERFLALVPAGEAADRVRHLIEELRQRLN
ncbi:tetratricopeptide repeat protein [Acetobacteraceae bacterium H6797]|nr:tetratricopeptide repeat protein [Acetobacteraceae bacterium H6797]